jgi:hypothetical protein
MKTKFAMAFAAAAVMAMASSAQAKECKKIGAAGSGLTQGIAEIMAKGGVKTLIDSRGMTPVGEPKVKCKDGGVLTECHATQTGCK